MYARGCAVTDVIEHLPETYNGWKELEIIIKLIENIQVDTD
jgi:hypothetical protein